MFSIKNIQVVEIPIKIMFEIKLSPII